MNEPEVEGIHYPEHDRLKEVQEASQTIGEFLELGLPGVGLSLYEERWFDCECDFCERQEASRSPWHEDDKVVDGVAKRPKPVPTHKTISQILAEYFGIDQDKVEFEKREMLDAIRRSANK